MLDQALKDKALKAQKNEISEYIIYKNLASAVNIKERREILEAIASEELKHYEFFKSVTGEDVEPDRIKVIVYTIISRVLGLNFGLKLMENGEESAQDAYAKLENTAPEMHKVIQDEKKHERELISFINEDRLKYISSIVAGLNGALVGFTGILAGFTLAMRNARAIGTIGLITVLTASISMATSEYLSTKHGGEDKVPLKASIYTAIAYITTALFLIFPYLVFNNISICMAVVAFNAILVIFIFSFYTSVVRGLVFRKIFVEMACLTLGITAISFFMGLVIRHALGVKI